MIEFQSPVRRPDVVAAAAAFPAPAVISVRAPGRLHLGFLDPSASLGRRFGSLGLVIAGFETEVEIGAASVDSLHADSSAAQAELDRAAACLHEMRQRSGINSALALRLRSVLPTHAGFGSGTQLALAVGRAFARWHGLDLTTPTIAHWLGRGARSGIGIAGFDSGGLLVDGGPGRDGASAPLTARVDLPADWRIVVAVDERVRGLSGRAEREAIASLPALPQMQAADICHQVLMRILPGAADADFDAFAAGVNRVQELLGEHFAAAQSGSAWTSPAVGRLMRFLRGPAGDGAAIGQSSWGPTGFAIVNTAAAAQRAIDSARLAGVADAALVIRVVRGRNHGAAISQPASR